MRNEEYTLYDHLFPRPCDSLALSDGCTLCQEQGLPFVGREIIWGNGARGARVMVVGQGSARRKRDAAGGKAGEPLWQGSRCTGIPLTNKKTGAKLRIMLHKAGIDPLSVFITNTVKCNVGTDEFGLSYAKLVRACIRHLRQEITIVRPRVLIVLGEPAARQVRRLWERHRTLTLTGLDSTEIPKHFPPFSGALSEVTGEHADDASIEVFALKHPSYIEGPREESFVANLRAIGSRLG